MDLFEMQRQKQLRAEAPLAARMRPESLADFVGQEHLTGENRILRKSIEADQIPSMILWGPPGSGKTTLAGIIAAITKSDFRPVSAVASGVAELRKIIDEARDKRALYRKKTILFIDEIHRFNKAQQDVILPFVEDGTVTLIGATTEKPSFEVISPLLSRCRTFTLKALGEGEIKTIIERALKDEENGLGRSVVVLESDAMNHLVNICNGDARVALNALELAAAAAAPDDKGGRVVNLNGIEEALQKRLLLHDKAGDQHYDLISALHKSLRGSDPDASLYWLGRMLEAGEDPLYIARRMVRFASEDVGMADPQALVVAMAAQQAVHFIGLPEGKLALAEAAVYLATAPKSNSLYQAYSRVQEDIKKKRAEPVPLNIRNAVTPLMRDLGYGKGYKYAHDFEGHFTEQQYLPDALKDRVYYTPSDQGMEKDIAVRLNRWRGQNKKGTKKP
ncbi:MAG: replication-associated recombination protein A [Dehalococcoidia bacterium]|nr:replication-associated recombination protein A [Dehalococcoidia bacterium]